MLMFRRWVPTVVLTCLSVAIASPGGLLPYPRSEVPTGQAGAVYVVSETNISSTADKVTIQTLAGVLARHSPRIYTIKSADPTFTPTCMNDDTTVFWLNDLESHHNITFDYTYLSNSRGLLQLFADSLSGFVAYDPNTQTLR
jgi:hypothetical protein